MRVSERHRYWVANRRINKARTNNTETLNMLSSQKRINSIHDDPVGLARTIKYKERLSEIDDFKKNIDFTKGYLDVTESAISGINDRLSRAYELSVAMANDSYGPDSRDATAKEVKQLVNQVIQLGNSKYNGKYVFGGFRSQSPALDREGNFLGDDGVLFLQLGPEHYKRVNISGRDFFESSVNARESGHFNMLDALSLLQSGLESNNKDAIYKAIDELEFQMEKTTSYQASVGAVWGAIEEAEKRLELSEHTKTTALSRLEDLDVYKASSDFKRTESILQSTLLASNRLLQPSLLNFMQ